MYLYLHLQPSPIHLSLSLSVSLQAESMKQRFHSYGLLFIFFLFLLSSSSTTAARFFAPREGEEEMKVNGITHGYPLVEIKEEDSLNLMGVEDCENGDEECLKRRMVSEAHLDYIYTQHHKP